MEKIKRCGNCGRFLGEKSFYFKNKKKGVRESQCKKCNTVWRWILRHTVRGRLNNILASRKWKSENPNNHKEYYKNHIVQNAAKSAKRRALKINQTPEDVDQIKIQRIYTECGILNKLAGHTRWHVDHYTPLSKGGWHHENNLQLLLATENLSKGAKLNWLPI